MTVALRQVAPADVSEAARQLGKLGGRPRGSFSSPLSRWLRIEIKQAKRDNWTCRDAFRMLIENNRKTKGDAIVGRPVLALKPAESEAQPVVREDFTRREVNAKEAERLEQVRKLAKEVPPVHDCQHRRDILAARAELSLPVAA